MSTCSIFGIIEELLTATCIHKRTGTLASHGCQLRILWYLHTPPLVVGKMPVKAVHLVKCHDVKDTHYFVFVEEVACHIEHKTTMVKGGRIVNEQLR